MDFGNRILLEGILNGNNGTGTSNYQAFERSHAIMVENKPMVFGSTDPALRGYKTRHNPEELLVASIPSRHMLWYLHLCAEAGVVVTDYSDQATAFMIETVNGGGRVTEITLQPNSDCCLNFNDIKRNRTA